MSNLAEFVEHQLTRAGCTLHYWLAGPEDRPLVALLHGATMDHGMFQPQLNALADHYRVLTWDTRGHGKSRPVSGDFRLEDCADDLAAILDQLQVQQAVIVGQSMGGIIAQYVYLRHPERVRAMGMIGSVPIAMPYNRWEVWALKATLPLFDIWPYNHFVKTVVNSIAVQPEVREYARQTIQSLSREDFLTIWKAVSVAVNTTGLPGHQIQVPLLLTHGDQDKTGTIRRDMPKWAKQEPDVRYVIIPNAGHNANQDNPVFFNQVLLDWLKEKVGWTA